MNEHTYELPPDYHSHTRLCKHADGEPADYVRMAEAAGIAEFACTDHCPAPFTYDPEHRMALEEFDQYRQWVAQAQADSGLRVLFGVEADYHEGCEEYLDDFLRKQEFDVVLGSVHYASFNPRRAPSLKGLWNHPDPRTNWAIYLDRIGRLADTGLYDVVGHLDLPKRFGGVPQAEWMEELMPPILDRIAKAGMAIEINTSGINHLPKEPYPSLPVLTMAHARNIPITFGSDAHSPVQVGQHFEEAVALARRAGYTHSLRFQGRRGTPVLIPGA